MKPKLDYDIKDQSKRVDAVRQMVDSDSWYGNRGGLQNMADYVLFANDSSSTKTERHRKYPIQTKNRKVTTDKRETSLDNLMESLAASPFSIYDFMNDDRNAILEVRDAITDDDLVRYPELRQYVDVLAALQRQFDRSTGRKRYELKRQIIETWQQMYLVRASKNPARCLLHAKDMSKMNLPENVTFDEDGYPVSDGMVSLLNPVHISFLLENYMALRQEVREEPDSDMWCMLLDLEDLVMRTFPDDSEMRDIMLLKMLGFSNAEIDERVRAKWDTSHTKQYYSMVWRQRIPKMLCQKAQELYVLWYWRQPENHTTWKRCSKCGRLKPAHPLFFTRSNSKDGLYSACRECGKALRQGGAA